MVLVVGAKALLVAVTTVAVFLVAIPSQPVSAFSPVAQPQHHHHRGRQQQPPADWTTTLASLVCKESDAELIHDIKVMEGEAKHRLQNLMEQMDELHSFQTSTTLLQQESLTATTEDAAVTRTDSNAKTSSTHTQHDSSSSSAPPLVQLPANGISIQEEALGKADHKKQVDKNQRQKLSVRESQQQQQQQQSPKEVDIVRPRPLDLLDGTSWKIVLNIGREESTWMPPQWGKSGSRLRVEVHCTFTNVVAKTKDLFFAHSNEPVYMIQMEEAFVWPTQVGVGRRSLPMDPQAGRYQICPGAGPAGTDLLRLMIPIPDDLQKDDVTLNAGRVYGTTGYFGHPDEGRLQVICAVQAEYDHCLAECAKLQREVSSTENVVAWCQARHAVWTAERALDRAMARMTLAGQHYPDHAHLRTDPTGRVGLAKEGGLCVSVHTGLAMEYHILGRMEVGYLVKR